MKSNQKIIFKNLILLAVIVICVMLVSFAWFATKTEADASGLKVIAGANGGLEISVDGGETYYGNSVSVDANVSLPLVSSGDGTNFVIPLINLTTGEVKTESDGTTALLKKTTGFVAADEEKFGTEDAEGNISFGEGDYLEQDIWFRSEEPMDVYLYNTSSVIPRDVADLASGVIDKFARVSEGFGTFTKDYIAGAARVALFNVTEKTASSPESISLNSIWVPNEKYQLVGSTDFTALEKVSYGDGSTGFDPPSTDGWVLPGEPSESVYLWEGYNDKNNSTTGYQSTLMNYEEETGKYWGVVDVRGEFNVDHMVYISFTYSESAPTGNYLPNENCYVYTDQAHKIQYQDPANSQIWVTGSFEDKYTADNRSWTKLYLDVSGGYQTEFFNRYDRFQVLISLDTKNKVNNLPVLSVEKYVFYDKDDPSIVGGAVDSAGAGDRTKYDLTKDTDIIITGSLGSTTYALSVTSGNLTKQKVYLSSGNKIKTQDTNLMFHVEEAADGYLLRSVSSPGSYLAVNTGKLGLSDVGSVFTVTKGTNGPLLSSGGQNICFNADEGFVMGATDFGNMNVYEGSSYNFNANGTPESSYTYYNSSGVLNTLTNYYLTSQLYPATKPESTTYIAQPVVRLQLNETDGLYYGHIRVRIWVEGTDREAKIPLEGGIFNTKLAFAGNLLAESA